MLNPRICAARILAEVLFERKSLAPSIKLANKSHQMNLTKELSFGVCRYYFQLKNILNQLMSKSLNPQEAEIECLLLSGIYELNFLNTPSHATVNAVVECTKLLKKNWATKLVNAVLRNFIRRKSELITVSKKNIEANFNHPRWLIEKIKHVYPQQWETVLDANNQQAAMILRVNQQKISTAAYFDQLQASNPPITGQLSEICNTAIILDKACKVSALPDFAMGYCSVQDINAQLAIPFLQLQPEQNVLDACAAPGGKAAHILEAEPKINSLIAIDSDVERIHLIHENFSRLQLSAQVISADACDLSKWWNNKLFDRILLDAPCSATGVIRRHPDIKLLRQKTDIQSLIEMQRNLLVTLWQTLKPNGLLLYVTCSILPEENSENIAWFLQKNPTAKLVPLNVIGKTGSEIGLQLLPGEFGGDGFYYCLLKK